MEGQDENEAAGKTDQLETQMGLVTPSLREQVWDSIIRSCIRVELIIFTKCLLGFFSKTL